MLQPADSPASKLSIDPELLALRPGLAVLDLGCGDGRHALQAARRGCSVVAVDVGFWELVKAAVALTGSQSSPAETALVRFVMADAAHLPFPDGAFDRVVCAETLEHLPDDRATLREAARVLRPGGRLALSVPSHFTERVYWALSPEYGRFPGGHLRIYDPPALLAELRAAGLRPFAIRYVHFLDSILWLRYCLLDRSGRQPRRAAPLDPAVQASEPGRPASSWRRALRRALPRSTAMRAVDAVGALVFPKSLVVYADKPPRR